MSNTEHIAIWTIYDHPKDDPDFFVARLFMGFKATDTTLSSIDLQDLRETLQAMHDYKMTCIPRAPSDPAVIVESWI